MVALGDEDDMGDGDRIPRQTPSPTSSIPPVGSTPTGSSPAVGCSASRSYTSRAAAPRPTITVRSRARPERRATVKMSHVTTRTPTSPANPYTAKLNALIERSGRRPTCSAKARATIANGVAIRAGYHSTPCVSRVLREA